LTVGFIPQTVMLRGIYGRNRKQLCHNTFDNMVYTVRYAHTNCLRDFANAQSIIKEDLGTDRFDTSLELSARLCPEGKII